MKRASLNLTFAVLISLTGCAVPDEGDPNMPPPVVDNSSPADEPGGEDLGIDIVARGSYGKMAEDVDGSRRRAPFVEVARSDEELESLWQSYVGDQEEMPEISFESSIVVFLLMPPQPTGGYGIEPLGASTSGDTLKIDATLHQPGTGAIVTQAFTAPYAVVEVPGAGSVDRIEWINQGRLLASTER